MGVPDETLTFDAVVKRGDLQVSRSPWGPDDEIGRLNWITKDSTRRVLERLDGGRVFELAVDYFLGMPSWAPAGDPLYQIWMTHTAQGSVNDNLSGAGAEIHQTYSYSGDSIAMYTHCGTHLDTLNHFGYFGCYWNGWTPETHLGSRHWLAGGPDKYPTIIARGVLLDIAGLHGVPTLPASYAVTPNDISACCRENNVELHRGDVVLVRTGRMQDWPDFDRYVTNPPGLGLAGARYLCEDAGAMCIAADTLSFEVIPAEGPGFMPVHCYMLATAGAQIIEVVRMEELAAEKVYEFAFIGGPLRLTGATGSPLRPIAVPLRA